MGMDVVGRKPSAEAGRYFRANVWSWRPIHHLMAELCDDLLDEETLVGMGFNDGAGPPNQKTCSAIVNRFEQWMERHVDGTSVDLGVRVTPKGQLMSSAQAEASDTETVSPYEVDDDLLKEWVEFLRHCGGFQVW